MLISAKKEPVVELVTDWNILNFTCTLPDRSVLLIP